MNSASAQGSGQPALPHNQLMAAAVTSIREFLAFKLGTEEYWLRRYSKPVAIDLNLI